MKFLRQVSDVPWAGQWNKQTSLWKQAIGTGHLGRCLHLVAGARPAIRIGFFQSGLLRLLPPNVLCQRQTPNVPCPLSKISELALALALADDYCAVFILLSNLMLKPSHGCVSAQIGFERDKSQGDNSQ